MQVVIQYMNTMHFSDIFYSKFILYRASANSSLWTIREELLLRNFHFLLCDLWARLQWNQTSQLLNTFGAVQTYEHVVVDGSGHYKLAALLRPCS